METGENHPEDNHSAMDAMLKKMADEILRDDSSDSVKNEKFELLISCMLDELSDTQLLDLKASQKLCAGMPGDFREFFFNLIDGKIALRQIHVQG